MSRADYVGLHAGREDFFAAVHYVFASGEVEITGHHFSAPAKVLCRMAITGAAGKIEGDLSVWGKLPSAYTVHSALVRVHPERGAYEWQGFDWFDGDAYDTDYQGIVGVVEVPSNHSLIVSVQRDSQPVICDPRSRQMTGRISLAGRCGDPALRFRTTANELWARDYDTMLRIDPSDWHVMDSQLIQPPIEGAGHFVGHYAFTRDERICAVARPFSGDVVGIDTRSFKLRYRCLTGGQPLEVAVLEDRGVVARDWQTGNLLRGRLTKISGGG